MRSIHVIDPEIRRRAEVARIVSQSCFHSEIYEDFGELVEYDPKSGLIFASEEIQDELVSAMTTGDCALPVVFYGSTPETCKVSSAMRAGALDFLDWPLLTNDLDRILDRLLVEAEERGRVLDTVKTARDLVGTLSHRENEVLRGVVFGGSNKSIAQNLGISPRTVEIHRGNMMRKLEAESAADAVRIAISWFSFNLNSLNLVSWKFTVLQIDFDRLFHSKQPLKHQS
jgi:FixJ family two-component response regulator